MGHETYMRYEAGFDMSQDFDGLCNDLNKLLKERDKTIAITDIYLSIDRDTGIGWVRIHGVNK